MIFLKKINLFLLVFFGVAEFTSAQLDSIIDLKPIEVTAKKIRNNTTGGQVTTWKKETITTLPASNIAEFLESESLTFIKSYGQGSLGTASIRGGSAGQTLVLWNGLPLQSPMLGLLDLSLLPSNGFEEISLEKGGNSALWGSGAIAGVISLNNESSFENSSEDSGKMLFGNVQSTFGSFGYFNQNLKFGFGNARFQSVTKLTHQEAKNDFEYNIAPDFPKRLQTNAAFQKQNLLQDFYWKINKKNQIAAHVWLQKNDVQIPPTNVQTKSEAHQEDQSSRIILDWKRVNAQHILQSKIGFFDERQTFFDEAINLEAYNNFKSLMVETESQWFFKNQNKLVVGATHFFTQADSRGYGNKKIQENKSAVFASHQFQKNNLKFQSSLRQELVDGKLVPIVPAIGLEYQPFSFQKIKFKASRNYRLPTLNDRNWLPGGNINLLPESGWSQEMGHEFFLNRKYTFWKYNVTAFNRNIKNWILWIPRTGDSFWSANNIAKVWSRGVEQFASFIYKKEDLEISCYVGYDYILSTNQVALTSPAVKKGQQLIYTPKHQASSKVSVKWKNIQLNYQHRFNGKMRAVNGELDRFYLGSGQVNYHFNFNEIKSIAFFQVNNIWNTDYFVVERRPMPGRNFQIGITLSFNN